MIITTLISNMSELCWVAYTVHFFKEDQQDLFTDAANALCRSISVSYNLIKSNKLLIFTVLYKKVYISHKSGKITYYKTIIKYDNSS